MSGNAYQGYLILKHRAKMKGRMYGQVALFCAPLYLLCVLSLIFLGRDFAFQMVPAPYRELAWKWPLARLERAFSLNETFILHSGDLPHRWSDVPANVVEVSAEQLVALPYSQVLSFPYAHWNLAFLLSLLVWPCWLHGRSLYRRLKIRTGRGQVLVSAFISLEQAAGAFSDSQFGGHLHSWSEKLSRAKLVRPVLEYGSSQAAALMRSDAISQTGRLLTALWSRARSGSSFGTLIGMCLLQAFFFVLLAHLQFTIKLEMVPAPYRELALKWPIARLERVLGWNGTFYLHSQESKHWWNDKQAKVVAVRAKELVALPYIRVFSSPNAHWGLAFLLASPVWLLLFAVGWKSRRETRRMEADQHIRGARLCREQELAEACSDGILYVGTIRISEAMSRRHILIVGQSGSGKTFLTVQHLVAIQRAGRRALVNDFKGYLVERFYRKERDLILNPLDERGIKWTVFNDIKTRLDLASVVGILIPLGKDNELFWTSAAQDVLRGIIAYCYKFNKRTNAYLCNALSSPIEQIAKMCQATEVGWAGYRYLQDPRSKMAEGIIAVLTAYVNWLEFAPDGNFSLREWVETRSGATIFMTSLEEAADIMKPYLSLVTDLVVKRLLSLPEIEDPDHSIYLQLDELSNMHRLSSVTRLITAGRSKGVAVEIGIQDMAGVVNVYGREETKTIINNCGSKMILNLGEPDGAELCSELCGMEDYWQSSTTYTIDPDGKKVTETHSRQQSTRRVVMPTQIMRLRAGRGYFMFPGGDPALVRVPRLRENVREVSVKKLKLREGLSMEDLKIRNDEVASLAQEVLKGSVPPEMVKIHEQIARERKPSGCVLAADEALEIDFRDELIGKE